MSGDVYTFKPQGGDFLGREQEEFVVVDVGGYEGNGDNGIEEGGWFRVMVVEVSVWHQ